MQYSLGLAVERAVDVFLERPLHVVRDEDVEPAVAIVVEPRRARAEVGVLDTGRLRHVAKPEVPLVVEQSIALDRGHIEIVATVVVVIAGGNTHPIQRYVEPAPGDDVRERGVAVVLVDRRERLAPARLPVAAVNQDDIEAPVVVQIDERTARAHGFWQIFLTRAPVVVHEGDAGRGGDISERHGRRRWRRAERRSGNRRSQRQRNQTESLHFGSVVGGSDGHGRCRVMRKD